LPAPVDPAQCPFRPNGARSATAPDEAAAQLAGAIVIRYVSKSVQWVIARNQPRSLRTA
jgi:hypothetical protein